MAAIPGSRDGSEGPVLDGSGNQVATFAMDDQRVEPDDDVFALFENRDPAWEQELLAAFGGTPMTVSMVWPGERLDDVLVVPPVSPADPEPRPGPIVYVDDPPSPLDGTFFLLRHPDL